MKPCQKTRGQARELTNSIIWYKPSVSVPRWDPNFEENITNNIVPSRNIYSKFVPAGKMRIPTKIRSNPLSPSQKIGSPVRIRSSHQRCFVKKGALKNFTKFTGKYLCQSLFIKKETLAQVLSCEFCEISESTFLHRTPLVVASVCRLGS